MSQKLISIKICLKIYLIYTRILFLQRSFQFNKCNPVLGKQQKSQANHLYGNKILFSLNFIQYKLIPFIKEKYSESESHSVASDSLRPHGLYSPWNFPDQNTGVGSLSFLQGIFPTQSPTLQADSLPAKPQEKPKKEENSFI